MDVSDARKRRSAILKTLNIPPASAASDQLLELVKDEEVDIASLAQAIQAEPGITARVISIANSSFFSAPNPVHTVEEAMIKVLGLKTVRSLVMSMLLGPKFNTKPCPVFSLQGYWCRAQSVAQSATLLAKKVKTVDTNKVYLAGLLHSMGQLLLVHHFPKEMNKLLPDLIKLDNLERLKHERKVLGINACDAGSWIAKRWDLPVETAITLQHYLDPDYKGEHWEIVRTVGFVVRYLQQDENLKANEKSQFPESETFASLFDVELKQLQLWQENFDEIEQSVSVLAEFLISHE